MAKIEIEMDPCKTVYASAKARDEGLREVKFEGAKPGTTVTIWMREAQFRQVLSDLQMDAKTEEVVG